MNTQFFDKLKNGFEISVRAIVRKILSQTGFYTECTLEPKWHKYGEWSLPYLYIYFNAENKLGIAENKKMVLRFVVFGNKSESVGGNPVKTVKNVITAWMIEK